MRFPTVIAACLALLALPAPAAAPRDPVGTAPPEWTAGAWVNSDPLTLASLRGKVVLVRWWTGPGCEFCTASAPALDSLWKKYRGRGLVVVGMYHHKAATPLTRGHVVAEAKRLGFAFPVAIDDEWKTLRSWWLDGRVREFTSVTFVIDREGVVRHVHPGGTIRVSGREFDALDRAVRAAL